MGYGLSAEEKNKHDIFLWEGEKSNKTCIHRGENYDISEK